MCNRTQDYFFFVETWSLVFNRFFILSTQGVGFLKTFVDLSLFPCRHPQSNWKSFATSITVTKEERELKSAFNADKQMCCSSEWFGRLHRDEDLNLQFRPLTCCNGLPARITNSNSGLQTPQFWLLPPHYFRQLLSYSPALKSSKLPTFHGLYVFTGRPHKFYILIFVKISQGIITGDNLADETGSHWVV